MTKEKTIYVLSRIRRLPLIVEVMIIRNDQITKVDIMNNFWKLPIKAINRILKDETIRGNFPQLFH